jgi:anti-anti-sigma regulatory factor
VDILVTAIVDRDGAVVVDLADIHLVDSTAGLVLARAGEFLGHHGRTLTLRAPTPPTIEILATFGLSDLQEPL